MSDTSAFMRSEVALWQFEDTVLLYSVCAWLALRGSNALNSAFLWRLLWCKMCTSQLSEAVVLNRDGYIKTAACKDKDLQHSSLFTSDGLKHVWWSGEEEPGSESGGVCCCSSEHTVVSVQPFTLYCTQRNPIWLAERRLNRGMFNWLQLPSLRYRLL